MDGPRPRLSRSSLVVIALFGATMSLVHLGPVWALTYHEAYFAEPAREMLRTGDWLIPRIGGVPSWQKPPLTHWMIASTMGLLRTESEWAVRLPTLICAILNAIFIAALAARWHGDRIGRLAGLIQLTTFYGLFQGRLAESDIPLCATVSGAMLALAYGTIDRERSRLGQRLAFFAAAGLSTLIKGPFGLALIGGAAGLFAIFERRWAVWRFLLDPIGWLVMIALTISWPVAAYRVDPSILDAFRVHNVDRFSGTYDGQTKGVFFYVNVIPALLLPWTPLALGGLVAGWRDSSRPRSLWRLMTCWMAVGLALISASAWKHKHYPIPLLPPMSIIAAYGLDRYIREAKRTGRSPAALLAAILVIGGTIAACVFAGKGSQDRAIVAGLIALCGIGLGVAFRLRRAGLDDRAFAALFATIWLIVVLNESFVMPSHDLYRLHAEMAKRVNAQRKPGEVIDVVEARHPQIYFYLKPPFRRFDTLADYTASLATDPSPRNVLILASGETQADLEKVTARIAKLGAMTRLDRADGRTPSAVVSLTPESTRVAGAISAEKVVR